MIGRSGGESSASTRRDASSLCAKTLPRKCGPLTLESRGKEKKSIDRRHWPLAHTGGSVPWRWRRFTAHGLECIRTKTHVHDREQPNISGIFSVIEEYFCVIVNNPLFRVWVEKIERHYSSSKCSRLVVWRSIAMIRLGRTSWTLKG